MKKYDRNATCVSAYGLGGPAVVDNAYPEGTYGEIYANISQGEAGLRKTPALSNRILG